VAGAAAEVGAVKVHPKNLEAAISPPTTMAAPSRSPLKNAPPLPARRFAFTPNASN
jgi:hypothetical protein